MKVVLIGLLALFLSTGAFAATKKAPPPPPPPDDKMLSELLIQDIKTEGPKRTIEKLKSAKSVEDWILVLDRIATGKPEWLEAAKFLANGADILTALELQVSLAKALATNPEGVLRMLDGNVIAIERICNAPFSNDDLAFTKQYFKIAEASLKNLNAPAIEGRRARCLRKLQQTIEIHNALHDASSE